MAEFLKIISEDVQNNVHDEWLGGYRYSIVMDRLEHLFPIISSDIHLFVTHLYASISFICMADKWHRFCKK